MINKTFLLLGGAGLVGRQIAFRIANDIQPERIIIGSLRQNEVEYALDVLNQLLPETKVEFIGEWGNIFVRQDFANINRGALLEGQDDRQKLYEDMLGDIPASYERSELVRLIEKYKPDVVIDAINTATAISYQDVCTRSNHAREKVGDLLRDMRESNGALPLLQDRVESAERALETLLISQSIPQLVRHMILINQAMRDVGTRLYLKIGTTGTGGMGLNIPYTHGEDRPSQRLMAKSAVAFAHTGLLFLMARTLDGPIVKEIKPAAMIGYSDVSYRTVNERGVPMKAFASRTDKLNGHLTVRATSDEFETLGDLKVPVVDTGENGVFTLGEFDAITAIRQMEFMTPEEIAQKALLEIQGANSGKDVIAALDASVMDATYRAGYIRQQAISELELLEKETEVPSVALGQLGPPQLSKLLWEAELLRREFGTLQKVIGYDSAEISHCLHSLLKTNIKLQRMITSTGVPILSPDGTELMRGPFLRIPEIPGTKALVVGVDSADIDAYANKGWIDLRPANFDTWKSRFETMVKTQQKFRMRGSAAITREGYLFDDIKIGTIAGWIFNNEQNGYRIK